MYRQYNWNVVRGLIGESDRWKTNERDVSKSGIPQVDFYHYIPTGTTPNERKGVLCLFKKDCEEPWMVFVFSQIGHDHSRPSSPQTGIWEDVTELCNEPNNSISKS